MLSYLLAGPCFDEAAKRRCADSARAARGGEKVVMTCSNKLKKKFRVRLPMSRREEERQTIVIVEGDEETIVPQHKLDSVREQLQDLFKDPT